MRAALTRALTRVDDLGHQLLNRFTPGSVACRIVYWIHRPLCDVYEWWLVRGRSADGLRT